MKNFLNLFLILGAAVTLKASAETNAPKTFRCAGAVVDATGNPVAGAVVESYEYANTGPFGALRNEVKQRVSTGINGTFEFQSPHAAAMVLARKPGLAPVWSQYHDQTKNPIEEHLVMTPPTVLAGIVVDEAEKPVSDAAVWVTRTYIETELENGGRSFANLSGNLARECFSTRTAVDGRFRIEGFPTNAAADLTVSKPSKVFRQPHRDYISPDAMQCRAGQQDIRLIVEPASSIAGKVVARETGHPLAGAYLGLQPTRPGFFDFHDREAVQSGFDGTFRFADVPGGDYRISAVFGTNAIPEWVAESVPTSVDAGQTVSNVQVSATRGGFVEVSVFGKGDRKPLAQVSINAFKPEYHAGASTGTNGTTLLRLPPGEYQISANDANSQSANARAGVEAGRTNRVEIELVPAPKITGIVHDPSGAPAPGAVLSVFPGFGVFGLYGNEIKTDPEGHYELAWNPQNVGGPQTTYCVIARDVRRNLAVAQDIDDQTTTLDLRLEPGLVISGRVEDVSGKALANATGYLMLWSGNMGSQFGDRFKADAQGRFEINALPADRRYGVYATAKGYGSANQQAQSGETETNRVELPPFVLRVADRRLAGQVVDADEKPVAGAWVSLQGDGQPNSNMRTDQKGRFAFDAVCEGEARLFANSPQGGGFAQATAEAGDTNVVMTLGSQPGNVRQPPRRASLKGRPLPDLAAVDLASDVVPAGKPILLCLFDLQQRPSRHVVHLLAEQQDALRQKGVTLLAVQAAITTDDALKEWKDTSPVPFPVGRVTEKSDQTKWASEVESLPWLILTDAEGRVAAEGFALDDLEAQLKALAK